MRNRRWWFIIAVDSVRHHHINTNHAGTHTSNALAGEDGFAL